MPRFIYIFGPDGSGKSTHARILASYLRGNGAKVRVVWIKSQHSIAFVLSRFLMRVSPRFVSLNPENSIIQIHAISNGSINRLIWALVEFVSVVPWVMLRVYLPLRMGETVIAERYLVDSVISIAYSIKEPRFVRSFVARLMLRFIPRNGLLIHLDSAYEEILRRRGAKADTEEYIEFQRSAYAMFSKAISALTISTWQQPVEKTAELIRTYIINC